MKKTFWTPVLVAGIASALFAGPSPALAVEPPALSAPTDTTAVWIDLESHAARSGVSAVETRAGGQPWSLASVASTPFGATAQATASAGVLDVRVAVSTAIDADVVVTFVDASGVVLDSVTLRDVRFAAPSAGANERWTNWADFETVPRGGEEASGGDTPNSGGAGSSKDPLAITGAAAPALWIVGSAAVAAVAGAALIMVRRRRSHDEGAR